MSTSDKTFSQVKDILRKLDRSIDEAREKRLSHDADDAATRARTANEREQPAPLPAPPARAEPSRSSAGNWMSR